MPGCCQCAFVERQYSRPERCQITEDIWFDLIIANLQITHHRDSVLEIIFERREKSGRKSTQTADAHSSGLANFQIALAVPQTSFVKSIQERC